MIDHAGIGNSGPAALFSDWRFIVYCLLPPGLSLVGAAIIGLSPFGARLIRNDALRFSIAALLMATPYCHSTDRSKKDMEDPEESSPFQP